MQPTITAPISILLSLSLLSGWFINDFQFGVALDAALASSVNRDAFVMDRAELLPNLPTPDIPTNWFSGNSASVSSMLLFAQDRKSDDEEHIAQGRIVGESYGNDIP